MSESTHLLVHRLWVSWRRNAAEGAIIALALILSAGLVGCGQEEVPVLGNSDGAAPEMSDVAAAGSAVAQAAAESVAEPDSTIADAADEAENTVEASDAGPAAESGDEGDLTEAEPIAMAPSDAAAGPPGSGLAAGRPYVVIRFPDSSVDYQEELAVAVRRAVERRPNVAFDLVAVTPRASTAEDLADNTKRAKQQAAEVLQSLLSLGIGADRIAVGAWTGQPTRVNEIRLYIR